MKTVAVALAFVALLGLGMASSISKKQLEGTGEDHVKEIAKFLMWGVYHECNIGFYMGAHFYLSQILVGGIEMHFGMCVMDTIRYMGQVMEPCAEKADPAQCLEDLVIKALEDKGITVNPADPEVIKGKAMYRSAYNELAQDCDGDADKPACLKREVGKLLTVMSKCVCPDDCADKDNDDKRSLYSRKVETPTEEPKDEGKLCSKGEKSIDSVVDEVLGYNPAERTQTSKKSLAALLRELIDAQKK